MFGRYIPVEQYYPAAPATIPKDPKVDDRWTVLPNSQILTPRSH